MNVEGRLNRDAVDVDQTLSQLDGIAAMYELETVISVRDDNVDSWDTYANEAKNTNFP